MLAQVGPESQQADSLFKAGRHQEAISIWEEVAKTSPHAGLYFNIGLAHAHLGQTANAIYAFEQGLRLDPSNQRLSLELEKARKQIPDAVIPLEPFFLSEWYHSLILALRPGVWALLGLIVLLLLVLHALAAKGILPVRHLDPGKKYLWGILPGVVMLLLAFLSYREIHRTDEAIVMQVCALRQAPAAESPVTRTLSGGEKVILKDRIGDWYHVALVNLDYGWIKEECLQVICIPE
jgi:tetratricopeptide (TPR) repeat protein